jgi:hypothetical protein
VSVKEGRRKRGKKKGKEGALREEGQLFVKIYFSP